MCPDEPLARPHIIKQRLLALRSHGGLLVRPRGAKIAGGVEKDGVKLGEILLTEFGSVLREGELPPVALAKIQQHLLDVARLSLAPGNNGMLKTARFTEKEDFPGLG